MALAFSDWPDTLVDQRGWYELATLFREGKEVKRTGRSKGETKTPTAPRHSRMTSTELRHWAVALFSAYPRACLLLRSRSRRVHLRGSAADACFLAADRPSAVSAPSGVSTCGNLRPDLRARLGRRKRTIVKPTHYPPAPSRAALTPLAIDSILNRRPVPGIVCPAARNRSARQRNTTDPAVDRKRLASARDAETGGPCPHRRDRCPPRGADRESQLNRLEI